MRLGTRYGNDRLEAACTRALALRAYRTGDRSPAAMAASVAVSSGRDGSSGMGRWASVPLTPAGVSTRASPAVSRRW